MEPYLFDILIGGLVTLFLAAVVADFTITYFKGPYRKSDILLHLSLIPLLLAVIMLMTEDVYRSDDHVVSVSGPRPATLSGVISNNCDPYPNLPNWERLRETLKVHEGFRAEPYRDPVVGKWTVGWGHTKGVSQSTGRVDERHAEELLSKDMDVAYNVAKLAIKQECVWYELSSVRKEVLINMAFNMGTGLYEFERFIFEIYREDWNAAAGEMHDSLWAMQTGQRAVQLARVFKEDRYDE